MENDDHFVSSHILDTYYATSRFPTNEELEKLGIDPGDAHHIHNGPETSLSSLYAQVDGVMLPFLKQESH